MSGPLGGQPGAAPRGGKGPGQRRMLLKGLKMGSFVLICYKEKKGPGYLEEKVDYEGTIADKRVGWDNRESYVELKDCVRLNHNGEIAAREGKKRLIDAFIEDCEVVERTERPLSAELRAASGGDAAAQLAAAAGACSMPGAMGMGALGSMMPMMGMGMPMAMPMAMGAAGMAPMGMAPMGMAPMQYMMPMMGPCGMMAMPMMGMAGAGMGAVMEAGTQPCNAAVAGMGMAMPAMAAATMAGSSAPGAGGTGHIAGGMVLPSPLEAPTASHAAALATLLGVAVPSGGRGRDEQRSSRHQREAAQQRSRSRSRGRR